MQVLEFHFNPKNKESVKIDSFVFEPENNSERRLGGLYMAGRVSSSLPKEENFLDNLAQTVKKEYYYDLQKSPESSLKQSLKKANEFLSRIIKKGKVDWMGNLDFAIVSVAPLKIDIPDKEIEEKSELRINFAQTGNIKILLIRDKEILDISQDIRNEEAKIYPLKTFEDIVNGRLMPDDKIIILTKNIFEYFKEKDLIRNFIKANNQKTINEILKSRKKELSELSGVCLFLMLEGTPKKKSNIKIPLLSLKKITPKIPSLPKIKLKLSLPKVKLLPKVEQIKKLSLPWNIKEFSKIKEKIIPIIFLILLLSSASFIFKEEKQKEFKINKQILESIEAEKSHAENLLIFHDDYEANLAFQSAWIEVNKLLEETNPLERNVLREEAEKLKNSIEESLFPLNNIEEILNPETVLEISEEKTDLIPQKIIFLSNLEENFLFLSNPFSSNIYSFNLSKEEGEVLNFGKNIKMATFSSNSLLLFSEPNFLTQYFPGGEETKKFQLVPQMKLEFKSPATYNSNIYFLSPAKGEITKYFLNNEENISGFDWLDSRTEKTPLKGRSMAIDGDIWILNDDFKIDRYYQGLFKKSLNINIFPLLENPTRLFASPNIPHLYILEPSNKRIIVMTKHGEIVKQYRSDEFNNLLDVTVSKDEKEIYLLNGLKVYRIKI